MISGFDSIITQFRKIEWLFIYLLIGKLFVPLGHELGSSHKTILLNH